MCGMRFPACVCAVGTSSELTSKGTLASPNGWKAKSRPVVWNPLVFFPPQDHEMSSGRWAASTHVSSWVCWPWLLPCFLHSSPPPLPTYPQSTSAHGKKKNKERKTFCSLFFLSFIFFFFLFQDFDCKPFCL